MPNNKHISGTIIFEYLDGELDPQETKRFVSHISTCASCQMTLEDSRKLFNTIESIPEIFPTTPLVDRVTQAILARKSAASLDKRLLTIPLALSIAGILITAISFPLETTNGYAMELFNQFLVSTQIRFIEIQTLLKSIPDWIGSLNFEPQINTSIFYSESFTIWQAAVILASASLLWWISTTRLLPENSSFSGTNGG